MQTISNAFSPKPFYDIVIVGGGLIGASLAVALEESDKNILLIEEFPIDDQNQPSYDERTVALTYSARQIYRAMGVWDDVLSKEAEPIRDIHISNRGHFGQNFSLRSLSPSHWPSDRHVFKSFSG